jgi:hypothetical protein
MLRTLNPTTSGRTLDVSSTGEAGVDWANVGSPTTTVDLSGTTIKTTQKVDVDTIKTNPVVNGGTITFPTNKTLADTTSAVGSVTGNVGGNVTGSVGSVASGGITAASIAADAITAAKIADGAIDAATFAAGAIDAAAIATDALGSLELAAGAASEIATAVRTELTTELGRVDAAVSSRMATYTQPTGFLASNFTTGIPASSVGTGGIVAASFAAGAIDAAAIATDAIGSAELAASAITEIQSGLSTLDAAGVRTAVGLATANLDTQLSGINSKTTNLPGDPADASDIAAAFSTVNSTLATIAAYIDTEVAAIKAKTDNLPSDPADASDIAASFTAIASTLTTIASYVDTEVAAIKTRVELALPAFAPGVASGLPTLVGGLPGDGLSLGQVAVAAPSSIATIAESVRDVDNSTSVSGTLGGDVKDAASGADPGAPWEESAAGHNTTGTMGAKMNSAASAGDPWSTTLPGSYADGTAGNIIGNFEASLEAADVTIVSAYSAGVLTIHKGAAYSVANGNSVEFAVSTASFPDLTAGNAKFRCKPPGTDAVIDYALSITGAGTVNQKIIWVLPVSESSKVNPPSQYVGFILYKAATASEYSLAYEFPVQTRSL